MVPRSIRAIASARTLGSVRAVVATCAAIVFTSCGGQESAIVGVAPSAMRNGTARNATSKRVMVLRPSSGRESTPSPTVGYCPGERWTMGVRHNDDCAETRLAANGQRRTGRITSPHLTNFDHEQLANSPALPVLSLCSG